MAVEKKPRARKAAEAPKTAAKATTAKTAKTAKATPRARNPKVAAQVVAYGPEHVAERAYYLWESGADGDQLEHWLRAERELATA